MIVVFAVVVIRSARVEFALFRFIVIDMVRARAYFEVHVGNRSQAHPFPNVSQYQCHEEERFSNRSSGGGSDEELVYHEAQVLLPLVFASINISISSKTPPPPPISSHICAFGRREFYFPSFYDAQAPSFWCKVPISKDSPYEFVVEEKSRA